MEVKIDGKEYIEKSDEDSENRNSGDWNLGYRNSGDWNLGYCNSGHCNSGDCNSGYSNSGNCNSGNCNSGNWNSGNWNSGHRNSGYLNIDKPYIRIFGKETKFKSEDIGSKFKSEDIGSKLTFPDYFYFSLTEWVKVSEMTEEEKAKYPKYAVTTGFLRVFDYKMAWKNSFEKAIKEDIEKTLKIPNFNYDMFEQISGITKKMIDDKLKGEE